MGFNSAFKGLNIVALERVQAVHYVRHRTQNSVTTGSYVCVFASDITSHLPTLRHICLHYVTFTYIYFLTCLLNHNVFRNLAVPFLEQVTCGMYVQAFVMLYRLLE